MAIQTNNKLDQLTALRFVAAFLIVLHHAQGLFGIAASGINFGQGVSFFFVLSGFILTYVYPQLASWAEVRRFWRARAARIWPGFLVTSALWLFLLDQPWHGHTALPYLLLLQGWIPMSSYYFSYNAAAWSISTEMFFYLAFPVLIRHWSTTWYWKLALALALLVLLMLVAAGLPEYGDPGTGAQGLLVTRHGLIYISPLSRIVEFLVGMGVALAWRRRPVVWGSAAATGYEAAALLLCGVSIYWMSWLSYWSGKSPLGAPAALWTMHCGSVFAFAVLVYVMAHGRGAIARALSHRFPVLLGEISFALYLVHQTLLSYYRGAPEKFLAAPPALAFGVFVAVLLLSAYLLWALVEMPGRRLLLGKLPIHATPLMQQSWRHYLMAGRTPLLAAVLLGLLLAGATFTTVRPEHPISAATADALSPPALRPYAGTHFDRQFVLRGLSMHCDGTGLQLQLAWESSQQQTLQRSVAVHLVNGSGAILAQADYPQGRPKTEVTAGAVWIDTVLISKDKLLPGVQNIALGLFNPKDQSLLRVRHASSDWDGHRLLVPIDACARP